MMWNAMGQGVDRSRRARSLVLLLVCVLLLVTVGAEGKDLYKVLGVDKQASQADIKKAFHKLSLKYHPDKNPSKDAQAKFTEISNAYEVLSDEEKRTNYDAYGDPAGPQGPAGGRQGWHHPGGSNSFQFSGFNGPQFTFSYGGDGPRGHSNFGNVFETFFGGSRGSQGSDRQNPERSRVFDSMEGVETLSGVKSNLRQQVIDKSKLAWLLLFYNPSHPDLHPVASALKEVANSLRGMIKVAVIDCKAERHLCDTEGALPLEDAKAFVYPYGGSDAAQYFGGWTAKSLKNFVAKHLPRLSTRLDTENFIQRFADYHALPRVLLFTKKKETPNMWRALSGLYDNQVLFFDMQVDDESDPLAKRFDVKEFPAVVGVLANGKEILLAGRSDLEGTGFKFDNLKDLIMKLRKESKEGGPRQGGSHSDGHVPYLTKVNSGLVCGKDTPLCIITVVKNAKLGEKSEKIMNEVSRKTLVRQAESYGMKKAAISYGLVDASKQSSYLHAVFRNPKFSNSDTILLALKPRRKKFALFKGAFTLEEVESFVSGVLVGDIHFENYKEDPVLSV